MKLVQKHTLEYWSFLSRASIRALQVLGKVSELSKTHYD